MTDALARVAEAHQVLTRGDLPRASQLAAALLEEHGDFPPAVHLAGLVARAAGDLSRAEDFMRRSLGMPGVVGRTRAEFANNLGNLLWTAGCSAAAAAAYRLSLEAAELPQARIGLGRILLTQDDPDAALGVLQRLPADSRGAAGVVLLSEALAQVGDRARALEVLRQAGEGVLAKDSVRIALGQRLAGLGRFEDGEATLAPLMSGPLEVGARLALAELRMAQQGWQAAMDVLAEGVTRHPYHAELLSRHAGLAWMLGDALHFADPLRRAVEARPDDAALRLALASTLENAGLEAAAEQALRDGITRTGDDARLLAQLAHRCSQSGRQAEAGTLAERALTRAPESELVREQAAIVALAGQLAEQALAHTAWLVQRRPRGQFALALRILALRLAGDAGWQRLSDPARVCYTTMLVPPVEFGTLAEFNAALAERLRGRHTLRAHPLINSVRSGTQIEIDPGTEPDPLLRAFFGMIQNAVQGFVGSMPDDALHPLFGRRSGGFRLSGCWTVRLTGSSGHHVSHIHPRGWLSSAYYVTVPPEVASGPARAGWLSFGKPPYPVPGLGPIGWVQPKAGRLALFPSYQWHGVEAFPGDGERMTIAFDVVPTRD